MQPSPPAWMRRSLIQLRDQGEPIGVVPLAQRLLALGRPLEPELARRVVAMALGRPSTAIPDLLAARDLRFDSEFDIGDVALCAADFVVVDLETTGLAATGASILEIGAVRVSRMQVVSRFETLVRPPGRIPPAIVRLTGIHDSMVAEAPTTRRALRAFRKWLDATASAPFVAHNAGFDHGFVCRELDACGLDPYRGPLLCTRRLGRRLGPELGRYSLDAVCAHFGVSNRARHRALGDADATATVLLDLLQIADSRFGLGTVGELLDLQRRPPAKRKRGRRR